MFDIMKEVPYSETDIFLPKNKVLKKELKKIYAWGFCRRGFCHAFKNYIYAMEFLFMTVWRILFLHIFHKILKFVYFFLFWNFLVTFGEHFITFLGEVFFFSQTSFFAMLNIYEVFTHFPNLYTPLHWIETSGCPVRSDQTDSVK